MKLINSVFLNRIFALFYFICRFKLLVSGYHPYGKFNMFSLSQKKMRMIIIITVASMQPTKKNKEIKMRK